MGFRFRKSFKIAPGVKLNFNKKSTGITFGGKGFHYTVNSKGKKTTSIGIPCTGLSYSTTSGGNSKKKSTKSTKTQGSANIMNTSTNKKWYKKTNYIILLLVLFFPIGLFLMWKYTNWNKYVKIAISAMIVLFAIIAFASPADSDENSANDVNSSINETTSDEKISSVEESNETTTQAETTTQEETTTNAVATTQAETTAKETTTKNTETTTVKSIGRTVYITPTGKRYHYDADCGGKNSYAVSIDNVGNRTPCKKCAQ